MPARNRIAYARNHAGRAERNGNRQDRRVRPDLFPPHAVGISRCSGQESSPLK